MHVHKLTLFNFKSFKGEHVLYFKPFLAVIGPNGSGKSNIFDALLYVLGESAKKLRHKSLKDVIYENETYCYVEVEFHCEKTFNSVILKRSNTNSKSKYHINNEEVVCKDLVKQLSNFGINLSPLQIIIQGEAELLSQKNPLELLELLEDTCFENLKDKHLALIGEFDKLNSVFENEKVAFEYYKQENKFVEKNLEEMKGNVDSGVDLCKIKYAKNIVKQLKFELENKNEETKIINLKDKIKKREGDELFLLEKQKKKIQSNINNVENEIESVRKEYHSKDRKKTLIQEKNQRITEKNNKRREIFESYKLKQENGNKEKDIILNEMSENTDQLSRMEKEIECLQKLLATDLKRIQEETEIKINNFSDKGKKDYNLSKLTKQIELFYSKKDMYERDNSDLTTLLKQINICNHSLKTYKDELESIEYDEIAINKLQEEKVRIEKELSSIKAALNTNRSDLDKMKDLVGNDNHNNKLTSFLQNIDGFYGKADDLFTAEDSYLTALIAAGRGNLRSFVVDTNTCAEKCIKLIREKKFGRFSFIVLDKIQPKKIVRNQKFTYVRDKMQCDSKYNGLFDFIFGDTVLCKNNSEAHDAAFKNNMRTVTLDGKLIEKSGLMSGGGVQSVEKDKFTKKIQQLTNTICIQDEEFKKLLQDLMHAEKELREQVDLKERKIFLMDNISKEEARERQLAMRNKEVSVKNKSYNQICNYLENLEKYLGELHKLIDQNIPLNLKKIKGELSILLDKREHLKTRNAELSSRCNEIENLGIEDEQNVEDLELESVEGLKGDVEEISKQLKELEASYATFTTEITDINTRINKLKKKQLKEREEEIKIHNEILGSKETISSNLVWLNDCVHKQRRISDQYAKYLQIRKTILDLFGEKAQPNVKNEILDSVAVDYLNELGVDVMSKTIKYDDLDSILCEFQIKNHQEVNLDELAPFVEKTNEYREAKHKFDLLQNEFLKSKKDLDEVENRRRSNLMETFKSTNKHLKQIYQKLTKTGLAELELVDYLDPFSGFSLSVMPPKKSWRSIEFLSGGEKTIASLSLLFALHAHKPHPFFIFDEIDAALDQSNVYAVGNYLASLNSQILIVSLRKLMFEQAKYLIGVYKIAGKSSTIFVDVNEIEKNTKITQ